MDRQGINASVLFSWRNKGKTITDAISSFFSIQENGDEPDTYVLLYAPDKCFIGRCEQNRSFTVSSGKEAAPQSLSKDDLKSVFEARVFNQVSELRWLNSFDGQHTTAILAEQPLSFDGATLTAEERIIRTLPRHYLLWGLRTDTDNVRSNWTQFATARIGSYFVPITLDANHKHARFTAVEYFREYEDGNVAIADERLTGIEPYVPPQ